MLRRALPRTKKGIFFSSFSASPSQRQRVGEHDQLVLGFGSARTAAAPELARLRGMLFVVEFEVVPEHAEEDAPSSPIISG